MQEALYRGTGVSWFQHENPGWEECGFHLRAETLAIQLGLLDATRLEQLSKDSGQSGGDSFASLIPERAGLSDHDQQGLRWLVERTLATQQVATNDRRMESTGATGQHTPEEPEFLSTIINALPQQSIISSATLSSKTPRAAPATTGVISSD